VLHVKPLGLRLTVLPKLRKYGTLMSVYKSTKKISTEEEESLIITCLCSSPSHQFSLTYEDYGDDWPNEFYLTPHLCQCKNFWGRVVAGIKYIFGVRSPYGDFCSISISPDDAKEIVAYIQNNLTNEQENRD